MASLAATETFAPGVVFDPDEKQLVFHYLIGKLSGNTGEAGFSYIREIDLYQHQPSQIPTLAHESGHQKWYFFSRLCKQGRNFNRQVAGGFWRKTGADSDVNNDSGTPTAKKTVLRYYMKDPITNKAVETRWLMNLYMLIESQPPNPNNEESDMTPWTLCVVYRSRRAAARRRRNGRNNADDN